MKPFRLSVAAAGTLAAALLGAPGALAVPSFGNDDLKGEYMFAAIEVRRVQLVPGGPYVPDHCVMAGSVTFDGAGGARVNGNQRCNQSGSTTINDEPHYYSVNPDGSFLIDASAAMTDPVHGQIVDKGRTLLLDGTTRTDVNLTSWWGTATKR